MIQIVSADRPEKDDRDTWTKMVSVWLRDERRRSEYRNAEFVECDHCAAKPGSQTLCAGCLANRDTISRLKEFGQG